MNNRRVRELTIDFQYKKLFFIKDIQQQRQRLLETSKINNL